MVTTRPSARWRGSSPLARGLRRPGPRRGHGRRIIPARAGFTVRDRAKRFGLGDHPRSRGVYHVWDMHVTSKHGSSPLARGLLNDFVNVVAELGIIPARAGFTRSAPRPPHALRGSSPLARGLLAGGPLLAAPGRIIPARAGFTARSPSRPSPRRDHPRSRGVYWAGTRVPLAPMGSSPLARGLRGRSRSRTQGGADHPRSRGVYVLRKKGD